MKLSRKQKKIQEQINKLLLAGIPLATLLSVNANGAEIKTSPEKTPVKKQEQAFYIVQPNDTMQKIAIRFKTTVTELCRINGIPIEKAGKIKPGQKLRIPDKNAKNKTQKFILIGKPLIKK